jgi:hypothetical protein
VAGDLPAKVIKSECKMLSISAEQRSLYAQAVAQYSARYDFAAAGPFARALGLLQYLRALCTDPHPLGLTGFRPETLAVYRKKAPKMNWLLR